MITQDQLERDGEAADVEIDQAIEEMLAVVRRHAGEDLSIALSLLIGTIGVVTEGSSDPAVARRAAIVGLTEALEGGHGNGGVR